MNQEAAAFIRASLQRAGAVAGAVEAGVRLGPVGVDLHVAGAAPEDAGIASLLRALPLDGPLPDADFRLDLAFGDGPLGAPPAEWPFAIDSRDSFQRVHWSPDDGLALASDETHGIWSLIDFRASRGLLWVADRNRLPQWEHAAP